MAQTAAEKKAVTEACANVPQNNGSEDAVLSLMKLHPEYVESFEAETKDCGWDTLEVHHIYKRPKNHDKLKNYRCNLIRLYRGVHATRFGRVLELCCLLVNWELNQTHLTNVKLGIAKELPQEEWYWNVTALNVISSKTASGRPTRLDDQIEVWLLPEVLGTELEPLARKLMSDVQIEIEADLPF